jgi:hypothetical protein
MVRVEMSRSVAPPSGLPPISPAWGEINLFTAPLSPSMMSRCDRVLDLLPCGGDVRQDRGGQRRALPSHDFAAARFRA